MLPLTAVTPEPGSASGALPPASPAAEPDVPTVRVATGARGIALTILAAIAVAGALELAQTFFVSLLLGILVAYTLSPLVAYLERVRIPRAAATLIVILGVIGAIGFGAYSLRGQLQSIIEQLPEAARTFAGAIERLGTNPAGNMQKMQSAAAEVEKATGGSSTPRKSATHVVIDQPGFKLSQALLAGSRGALGFLGQAVMVLFLAFFLLAGGDTFKRKLVRLAGPSLANKKITVKILDDINESIQRYLFMLLVTNALVAVLAWVTFRWIGLANAGAWAVAFGVLHVVPYLGPGVAAAATGMAAFMQFESFSMAFLVGGATLVIATVVGTFVTTWMTGRIAKMNPAAVFISLLFWGWLWGVWGMLLSIPIVVIVKVVSQHIEQLKSVAEVLGE
ncbi:MAG: AI-2E family transporter [Betaproteobacteria bacterium]|nr:AI-2E family transporter [Betaproteobacteria bacterium]MDE2004423.1 AI-2E family transporter [Betaproteobacteria bacterium]MDE2210258.1 AI-2E family transporter [Betaproteobacteria bacterium]MDE2359319.1 AI-2E family transporter [Betaproteobacteria bacterium]